MSVVTDPIFNPLAYSQQPQSSKSPSSVTSSQSIDTFQSISRTSSPIVPPPPFSKSGFERDDLSPPPFSKSRAPVNVAILDDAAEAFAKDLLFTSGPNEPTTISAIRSSSFLDSGFSSSMPSSSSSMHSNSTSATITASSATLTTATNIGAALIKPGVGAGSVGQAKSISGFSLGEDVADSSNPWMNTLADSLEQTKLTRESSTIDYTQSDVGSSFSSDVAFTLPSTASTTVNTSRTTTTTTATTRPISRMPMPPLDEDVGGFDDVFASLRSSKGSNMSAASSFVPPPSSSSTSKFPSSPSQAANAPDMTSSTSWNVLDAVEAAAHDPDFLGPTSLVNQSTAKVLEIMQMPKDALDKDLSAQEVFDNPWE
ncbi:hypothetical protein EDD21DRAFT_388277 [Dissophora ornata]|nr:hypothetical protein EDD21DRAFT_388277 [Dissophora ornata]